MHRHPNRRAPFLTILRILASSALLWSLNITAQSPDAPISCPTNQVINDVVCASAELRQQAYLLESKYLSAVMGANIKDVQNVKGSWRGHYIQCGLLVMNKREIDECILKSFKDFASELLKLAPELAMDRNALVKAAIDRLKTMVGLAREQRISCYRETAAAIDDNSSSARDIAVVITKQCRSTSMQVAQTMADSLEISFPMFNTPPSFESILSVSKDLSNPDDLISFVLEQRSARKRANRISPKPKPKPVQGGQTGKLEV